MGEKQSHNRILQEVFNCAVVSRLAELHTLVILPEQISSLLVQVEARNDDVWIVKRSSTAVPIYFRKCLS